MPSVMPYTAFVTRRVEREQGTFYPGGDGVGRFRSTDSVIDGNASGYSGAYMPAPDPMAAVGRFANFNSRGHMFRPFRIPMMGGRPILAQFPFVDGVDLGSIRRLQGLREGKFGVPMRASVTRGREIPVAMDRAVWARRPPSSLTSRVIR